jgi:hypothetical protein
MILTLAAGCALGIINAMSAFLATNGFVFTNFHAPAAFRAETFDETHLWLHRKALGVRTPLA